MEVFNQIFGFIGKLFEWWFVVMPWEQAVFIRCGNKVKVLGAGLYFKVPFIDRVYLQQIRLRTIDMPVQTVSTRDGKTITLKAAVAYSIIDIYVMFNKISHPELTLCGLVMGGIADHIKSTDSNGVSPRSVEDYLLNRFNPAEYGLGNLSIKITSWADVKTYRLIQDASWMQEKLKMNYIGEKINN